MKKILSGLIVGFVLCFIFSTYMDATKTALAEGVIRLHVVANSDSKADQELKLKVRDRILDECGVFFKDGKNIDTVRGDICGNLKYIEGIAKNEIEKNGYDYDVNVSFQMTEFPRKEYGNITLPAGEYQALKVDIGSGEGKNWWCVLFPPLCFVDETCVSVSKESNDLLNSALGESAYSMITADGSGVEFRMKTYELWQYGKNRIASYIASAKK